MNINEIPFEIKSYKFPEVDDKNMLKFSTPTYTAKNNIYFSNPNDNNILDDRILNGPRYIKISELPLNKKIKQPSIDIKHNSFKIPFLSPNEINEYYKFKPFHFIIALIVHLFIASFFVVTSFISSINLDKPEIVEVTFGLNDTAAQTIQKSTNNEVGESEATKTIRELPQLTKNVTPEVAQKVQEKTPELNNPNSNLIFKKEEKVIKPPVEKNENKEIIENKPIGPTPEKDKQKIKLDDYLKRKELDTRKEATIKTNGVREKDLAKPEGNKVNPNKIPTSPFASPSDLPDSPFAEAPSGVLDGKISIKSYNSYKAYIGRQLKLNWGTSEGNNFSSNLKAKVEFIVNPFGHLIGKPKIIKSSGNSEFDSLVINSLESTFPVSEAPPKEINPPKRFEASYSSKNVQ